MIRTAKNTKQRTSYLPISIGWGLKIAGTVAGFATWGADFAWVVLGVALFGNVIKGIVCWLVSLACLIGLVWFIFTHIFNYLTV